MHTSSVVEICCDSFAAACEALSEGADRIELCADLDAADGLTPSKEVFAAARLVAREWGVPLFVLIRLRGGSFVFNELEQNAMIEDAKWFVGNGADGVVTGALQETPDGCLDINISFVQRVAEVVRSVNPRAQLTFHKAIDSIRTTEGDVDDVLRDDKFLSSVAHLNGHCNFLLTSGGQPTALEGARLIRKLVLQNARGRAPAPIAAGRIRAENVRSVLSESCTPYIHSRSVHVLRELGKPRRGANRTCTNAVMQLPLPS